MRATDDGRYYGVNDNEYRHLHRLIAMLRGRNIVQFWRLSSALVELDIEQYGRLQNDKLAIYHYLFAIIFRCCAARLPTAGNQKGIQSRIVLTCAVMVFLSIADGAVSRLLDFSRELAYGRARIRSRSTRHAEDRERRLVP